MDKFSKQKKWELLQDEIFDLNKELYEVCKDANFFGSIYENKLIKKINIKINEFNDLSKELKLGNILLREYHLSDNNKSIKNSKDRKKVIKEKLKHNIDNSKSENKKNFKPINLNNLIMEEKIIENKKDGSKKSIRKINSIDNKNINNKNLKKQDFEIKSKKNEVIKQENEKPLIQSREVKIIQNNVDNNQEIKITDFNSNSIKKQKSISKKDIKKKKNSSKQNQKKHLNNIIKKTKIKKPINKVKIDNNVKMISDAVFNREIFNVKENTSIEKDHESVIKIKKIVDKPLIKEKSKESIENKKLKKINKLVENELSKKIKKNRINKEEKQINKIDKIINKPLIKDDIHQKQEENKKSKKIDKIVNEEKNINQPNKITKKSENKSKKNDSFGKHHVKIDEINVKKYDEIIFSNEHEPDSKSFDINKNNHSVDDLSKTKDNLFKLLSEDVNELIDYDIKDDLLNSSDSEELIDLDKLSKQNKKDIKSKNQKSEPKEIQEERLEENININNNEKVEELKFLKKDKKPHFILDQNNKNIKSSIYDKKIPKIHKSKKMSKSEILKVQKENPNIDISFSKEEVLKSQEQVEKKQIDLINTFIQKEIININNKIENILKEMENNYKNNESLEKQEILKKQVEKINKTLEDKVMELDKKIKKLKISDENIKKEFYDKNIKTIINKNFPSNIKYNKHFTNNSYQNKNNSSYSQPKIDNLVKINVDYSHLTLHSIEKYLKSPIEYIPECVICKLKKQNDK